MTVSVFTDIGFFGTGIREYISNGYCNGEISNRCYRYGNRIGCLENGQLFFGGISRCCEIRGCFMWQSSLYYFYTGVNKRKHIKCRQINNNVENPFPIRHFVFLRCLMQNGVYKK